MYQGFQWEYIPLLSDTLFFGISVSESTYGIICATCHLNYMGQTCQSLKERYSERI